MKVKKRYAYISIGVKAAGAGNNPMTTNASLGADGAGWEFLCNSVSAIYQKRHLNALLTLTGDTPSANDVMQMAFDADAGLLWFGSNDTWLSSGDPAAGTDEAYSGVEGDDLVFGVGMYGYTAGDAYINLGQLGFAHTPPAGFQALCSQNLPTPAIINSAEGFDVVTYLADATNPRTLTGLEFQPDLVWIKNRDNAYSHVLVDSVRGVNKIIHCDDDAVEDAGGAHGTVSAFTADGFTVAEGATSDNDVHKSGDDYVAWCFRKGAAYGFDIQTYEGTGSAHTESHDLGGVPELMIIKNLDQADYWAVYHHHALNKTDPETDYAHLNTTGAFGDSADFWNDTAPTASVFTIKNSHRVNANSETYIAYLWRSIPGFSKVGSYNGNGNADGPYVYCGFRPRWIMIKRMAAAGSWVLLDAMRPGYNLSDGYLYAETAAAEVTGAYQMDIDSSGLKLRATNAAFNANAVKFAYIAIAEQPDKYSNAR